MIAEISSNAFDSFFAWAPWVVGIAIYSAFWMAKRREVATVPSTAPRATYACSSCGRRGSLDQMALQHHEGAIAYQCSQCAGTVDAAAH